MTQEKLIKLEALEQENFVYGVTSKCFAAILRDSGFSRGEIEDFYRADHEFLNEAKLDEVFLV